MPHVRFKLIRFVLSAGELAAGGLKPAGGKAARWRRAGRFFREVTDGPADRLVGENVFPPVVCCSCRLFLMRGGFGLSALLKRPFLTTRS